jgi:hypothetical protein
MLVDTASGSVTSAVMAQSTGNAILDKITTDTFGRWRFKPGTVSQVQVPITYQSHHVLDPGVPLAPSFAAAHITP